MCCTFASNCSFLYCKVLTHRFIATWPLPSNRKNCFLQDEGNLGIPSSSSLVTRIWSGFNSGMGTFYGHKLVVTAHFGADPAFLSYMPLLTVSTFPFWDQI